MIQCFVLYEDYFLFYMSIRNKSWKQLVFNPFVFGYLWLAAIGIIIHKTTQEEFKVPELWIENIKRNCPGVNAIDIDPETANFEKLFLSFSILGLYIGVIIDQKIMQDRHIFFNDTSFWTSLKRLIVCNIVFAPTILPVFLISKNSSYWTVMIGK
jgi:hypothetical protein